MKVRDVIEILEDLDPNAEAVFFEPVNRGLTPTLTIDKWGVDEDYALEDEDGETFHGALIPITTTGRRMSLPKKDGW